MPGIIETVNMNHNKISSFINFSQINPSGIIPVGPNVIEDLERKHNRDRFTSENILDLF